MLKVRSLLLVVAVFVLVVFSFLGGRATAQQQPLPTEQVVPFSFPKTWGTLNSITTSPVGFAYAFETTEGTIRVAQATSVGVVQIQVIPRR